MEKFLPYTHQSINDDDIAAVTAVLKSDTITRGKKVEEFEETIADYCSVKYAVAFNSASSALQAACFVKGACQYDRLVSTPNTFVATIAAGMHYGAQPLFIDIDAATGNIDLNELKHNVHYSSSRGRSIYMPVHFAGIPVDMEALESMVINPDDIIIEDAAHALGSSYSSGDKVGCCRWSDITVFSFHPAKNITTGEGGMALTHDEEVYHLLKRFRNSGIERDENRIREKPTPWHYEVHQLTGNYWMTDIQAALGLSQFHRLDDFSAKRRALMARYRSNLNDTPNINFLHVDDESQVMFHLCVVKINFEAFTTTRAEVMTKLKEKGIGTQVHYIPVYRHPFFTDTHPDISSYFPGMEKYYAEALSLPLYYDLKESEVDYITKTLKETLLLN